ncbi:MAG: 16S rRNA (cytosine(1402)-N(4))-methyltransferase RsmH [Chloroflexota bacterium]
MTDVPHIPVLLNEVLNALVPNGQAPGRVIDGTLGAGGHAFALLEAGAGELLGLDQDESALALAQDRLSAYHGRCHTEHINYEYMTDTAARLGWDGVDAVLLDVGVSSMQLDQPGRGFSFMADGPLDMRMDPTTGVTAADLVNSWDATSLADIFYKYGEERHGRRLAGVIVENRPYTTTQDLVGIIDANKPAKWKEKIHPATRVFQALRIAVNDELGVLERVIPRAIDLLNPGGRLAIISFHSLEDRIVKHAFRDAATDCICPPKQPICTCDKEAFVEVLSRKPITATEDEIARNPRSRSAKLRVVEKL